MSELTYILKSYPFLEPIVIVLLAIVTAVLTNVITGIVLKQLIKKTKTEADDKILKIVSSPIFWSIVLGGIYIALNGITFLHNHLNLLKNLLFTISTILWGLAFTKVSKVIFQEIEERALKEQGNRINDVLPFLYTLTKLAIILAALLIILSSWGIDIRPALASAGVLGLAIAFAAKDTIANLFGGISVFFDKPYKTGDFVIFSDLYKGEVIEIGMRSTKIRTLDNVLLTVPNSVMVTNAVINETGFDPKLRIGISIGIAYNTNLEHAENVIVQTLKNHKSVVEHPQPIVRYKNFGESSIELKAFAVVANPSQAEKVRHELIKDIYATLRRENITIPFPQRDVHLLNNS
ncbi:MAG: mechanosensitive ion channel family protein [Patescibacteria group bacterium]